MSDWPRTAEDMLALMRSRSINASPLTRWSGTELLRCWDGEAELIIPFREELTQHRGSFHGAVLGMAADNACCWAAASLIGPLVTGSYTIHFAAPARGARLRAVAKVQSVRRRSAVVGAEIHVEGAQGRMLVATAIASMVALPQDGVAAPLRPGAGTAAGRHR